MCFIIGLPNSKGNYVIMMVVHIITKYAHHCALSHRFNESTIVVAFMDMVQNLHGNPNIIVSDRDPIFFGKFWIKLYSHLGTQLDHSSAY